MDESGLKSILMIELRRRMPSYVFLRHEDVRSSGHPDFTAYGNARFCAGEVKFANPDFKTHGIQDLTMLRLDKVGAARYIVYEQKADGSRWTYVFRPHELGSGSWKGVEGFNHAHVVDEIASCLNRPNR